MPFYLNKFIIALFIIITNVDTHTQIERETRTEKSLHKMDRN